MTVEVVICDKRNLQLCSKYSICNVLCLLQKGGSVKTLLKLCMQNFPMREYCMRSMVSVWLKSATWWEWTHAFYISGCLIQKKIKKGGKRYGISSGVYER